MVNRSDTLHTLGAETATGNSSSMNVGDANECIVFLHVSAVSGTTPTLDVSIQTSEDGTTWHDHNDGTFTQTTAVRTAATKRLLGLGRFIRARWVIAGTSPSFTFYVKVHLKG